MRGGARNIRNAARSARWLPLLATSAALVWPSLALAGDAGELAISVAAPEGYAVLTGKQTMVVDVFFGGRRLGEARIQAEQGRISFADPAAVAASIPGLKDAAKVQALLAAELPSNAPRVCSLGSDRSTCGRLDPDGLGLIFDRDNFRVELFLDQDLLEVEGGGAAYLPEPADGLSLINAVGAVVSGTVGEDRDLYDVSDRLLVGNGQSRAIADVGYSSEVGFRAEEMVLQLDRPELRYLGGAFWAPGTELIGRRKLLGAGIETQIDTRLDKEEIRANPIVVFLTQRSRVDIVRDGRILTSHSYEAGNQRIDTSGLPDGAYQIVLRVTAADGGVREETRFFNKSRTIPSPGRQDFFAFAGLGIDDPDALTPSNELFAQAGWARRVGEALAVDATLTYIDDELALQAGGTLITSLAVVRGMLLGTSEGTRGGLIQIGSGGYSRLQFNADLRHLEIRGDPDFLSGVTYDLADGANAPLAAAGDPVSSYWQGGATVSFSVANLQLFGSAFYRKNDDLRATYGIGPSMRWEFLQHAQLRLAVDGNAAFTERGTTGYLGVSLSLAGARSNYAARGGGRFSNVAGEPEGLAGALNGAWHMLGPGGSEVDLGAGYEREPERDNLSASGQLRGRAVSLNADLLHSENGHSETQYSAGAQTVFAVGPGVVEVQSRTSGDSMLVVRLDGARASDRFEVLVNDSPAGEVAGGDSLTLPLPAYYAYDVRLHAIGGQLTAYDGGSRRVGLYPGNVQVLEWDVRPIRIIVGRLLFDDGTPVAGASLKAPGGLAETDLAGNFQIEVTDDSSLEVLLADGSSYRVALPRRAAETEWASIGEVRCCSAPPRGGALAAAAMED
jgi:hypothetical protein